jgi:hypothetical protein
MQDIGQPDLMASLLEAYESFSTSKRDNCSPGTAAPGLILLLSVVFQACKMQLRSCFIFLECDQVCELISASGPSLAHGSSRSLKLTLSMLQ